MKFYSEAESYPREKLREQQDAGLRKIAGYVYERVPFYKKKFDAAGVKPGDIKGVEDLPKLPFTTKGDLRDNYPYGMFAVPLTRPGQDTRFVRHDGKNDRGGVHKKRRGCVGRAYSKVHNNGGRHKGRYNP